MLRRWSLGLVLSVLAHAGVVAVGLALGARGFTGPVEIELADIRVQDVKDFPLGGPEAGTHEKHRPRARPKSHAPEVAAEKGTLSARPGDETPKAGSSAEDEGGPAPTSDLAAYGPAGSRLTVLMRLDRLRGTEYQSAVDDLLLHLPDRRDLLQGTGLDLFADFDALLVATPNPRDPSVTFLAARHHLEAGALRAALSRGAKSTDRTLVWRREEGRFVAERRARKTVASLGPSPPPPASDDRIVVLSDPGLAVVTPPAYRALLLGPAGAGALGAGARDGGARSADADPDPDGGAARTAAAGGWATLLGRIDAEEGLMPPEGVVMLKATDLFKGAGSAPGASPVLYGMEVPPSVSGTIGIDDAPFLDVAAEFESEEPALHWETQWPVLQRKLRTHPYAILTGFSSLVSRAMLTRDGSVIRFHLAVTRDETVRLLALALQILSTRGL